MNHFQKFSKLTNFLGYHENELRTIDFFDAETGALLHQHSEPGVNGIMTLNRFNNIGDTLASATGSKFLIWRPDFRRSELISKKDNYDKTSVNGSEDDDETKWKSVMKSQTLDKKRKRESEKVDNVKNSLKKN